MIEGDKLSILELMYAMMLPSGNDAAVALGVHLGGIIKHAGTKDPEVVITPEAVERRLRALKLVAARNFREEKERSQQEQFDLNSSCKCAISYASSVDAYARLRFLRS